MNKISIEEIVQQLKTGKPVCVCKPFCGHWEAHAAKVLSKYLPAAPPEPPRHHKNCAIWTVTRDGDKNVCDCGLERKQFLEHLERASKLAATWQPWERHIFSSAPCGVDGCPCQTVANKGGDLRGVVPCRRCGALPEVRCLFPERDDHSWEARCVSNKCSQAYYGLTRNEAVWYWNDKQIDVEPYPFGRVGKNESDNTERR